MAAVTAANMTQILPVFTCWPWQHFQLLQSCRAAGSLTATQSCSCQAHLQGLVLLLALLAFRRCRRLGSCSFSTLHATRVHHASHLQQITAGAVFPLSCSLLPCDPGSP